MHHRGLTDDLRRLPRQQASADFTRQVMNRLDEAPPPRARVRPLLLAAALLLAVGAPLGLWNWQNSAPVQRTVSVDDVGARVAALRAEQRRLEREWIELRRLAAETEPVLYLGGNEQLDMVLDLRRLPPGSLQVSHEPAAARPASFKRPGAANHD